MTTTKETRRHHYRIADPVRFFIFILICTMIIAFAGYTVISSGKAEAAAVNTYAQVTVQENDSLWGLVEKFNPDANIDVQSVIYDIYEINDIEAGSIQPGDTIFIPVY